MQLVISGADAAIRDFAGKLTPERLRMALSVGVNATVRQSRAKAVSEVVKHGSIQRAAVERGMSMVPATAANLTGKVRASGRPLSLKYFSPRQNAVGVVARVWGKQQVYPHAFIVKSLGGGVFIRESASRLPIRKMFGAGIAQVMIEPEVDRVMRGYARERLEINVARQLDRYVAGRGGAGRA